MSSFVLTFVITYMSQDLLAVVRANILIVVMALSIKSSKNEGRDKKVLRFADKLKDTSAAKIKLLFGAP